MKEEEEWSIEPLNLRKAWTTAYRKSNLPEESEQDYWESFVKSYHERLWRQWQGKFKRFLERQVQSIEGKEASPVENVRLPKANKVEQKLLRRFRQSSSGLPIDALIHALERKGVSPTEAREALQTLMKEGKIAEVGYQTYKTV